MKEILVIGASGTSGSAVLNSLVKKGFKVKAASRNPEKLTKTADVTPVRFEFGKSYSEVLKNTDGVFLMSPPLDPEAPQKLNPFIDEAKSAGIKHIIFLSAMGADASEETPLRKVERHLMNSGINYTILRPNFFMENFSTGFLAEMVKHGAIYVAAGDGKSSFITVKDIAEVAAAAFEQKLYGKELNLTGPEALDYHETVKSIGSAVNKDIAYNPIPEEAMLQGAIDNGMPEGAAKYLGALYHAVREGWTASINDNIEKVTGKKPTYFKDFVKENLSSWK
ncbi:MAG: SDR family oxidoreductase [Acidobacteria bacterium]|nr:SDR family oxidoreductase [Acidobacteriota bacterium]